jgi:opacity protein-like surface antigen
MDFDRAKLVVVAGAALLASPCVVNAADYPMPPPPPPQQYYPPQPIYQPPPPQPMYVPPPVYQPPPPQPIYQPPPQVYQPPPVYMPPPVYVPPPPPVIQPPPPVVYQASYQGNYSADCCTGWYLRGDIGMSNQKAEGLDNALYAGSGVRNISQGFDSGMIFGAGVGYEFNSWFRVDVTGEYRGKTAFRGLDIYPGGADDYYGSKSEWLYLANLYLDLGTWWCLTPFVGVGVGMAKVTIHDFRDNNIPTQGVAYGLDSSQWNAAWALHAGVSYEVSKNLKLELSYRYVHLGDGQSGDLITYLGGNTVYNPMIFKNITSNDFRIGMRWAFGCCDVAPPPPPVMYQPPPPPPPLMRRG